MRILGIFLAVASLLMGIRLIYLAAMTAFTGKILARGGLRTHWEPAPSLSHAWKLAFRDALLGLLFIILGVVLLV